MKARPGPNQKINKVFVQRYSQIWIVNISAIVELARGHILSGGVTLVTAYCFHIVDVIDEYAYINLVVGLYTRTCSLQSNSSGFLCDDRTTCLTASRICDGKVDCHNGEDESKLYCGNLPHSLPSDLVFMCANKISWTYIDNVCDAKNDCGDCSDETTKKCLSCLGWRCNTVFFKDCDCIPKSRCKDTFQDCDDWSDENVCQP
uniref:LDLRAD1-like C-terminal domain-containing protein n=1 Tax=Erpetoichthys calabaricus TaxID=27687 RepID=A0A8C4T224_ERPCA